MQNNKTFLGSGKEIGSFGHVACSICREDCEGYWTESKNGKHYLNFILSKKKETDRYGKTHSVVLNDWTPEEGGQKDYASSYKEQASQEPNGNQWNPSNEGEYGEELM